MFSSFLSNFEEFINISSLKQLENITGTKRIKEIGDKSNPKLQFLNQGVNSKELILSFLLRTMEELCDKISSYEEDITDDLIDLFKQYSHIRIRWNGDSTRSSVKAELESGDKHQLSVKSRGTYYTPKFMSVFMCRSSIEKISREKLESLKTYIQNRKEKKHDIDLNTLTSYIQIKIVDFSMGVGNFLCDAVPHIISHIRSIKALIQTQLLPSLTNQEKTFLHSLIPICFSEKNQQENILIEEIINKSCLYGVEIDPKIHKMAEIILKFKLNALLGVSNNFSNLFCKNTIITPLQQLFPSIFHHNPKGFDIVIGNPPWEILKPNKREFFANYYDNYIHLSREKQDEVQNTLLKNGQLLKIYKEYIQSYTTQSKTVSSLGYSYQSSKIRKKTYTGDPQLFKIFLEIAFMAVKNNGVISLIVQHNFLGSKSCAALRSLYLHNGKFSGVWEFYNKIKNSLIFKNVDPNLRFIIIQFKKELNQQSGVNYKKCDSIESLQEDFVPYQKIPIEFYHKLSEEEYQLFGFKGEREWSVFEKILSSENDFSKLQWMNSDLELSLEQDLHVTRDRNKFSKEPTKIPIYGGKNFGPYYVHKGEHRYLRESTAIASEKMKSSIVCRNILPNSVKRIIFSTTPSKILVDNSCTRLIFNSEDPMVPLFFLAVANSLLVEFFLRIILTGINFNYYLIRRIPLPSKNILNDTKYQENISELCKVTEEIQKIESESEKWAQKYAKMEAITAILFKLTKNQLSVILDSFNFEKLRKSRLSKSRPFHKLTKEMILNHYKSESSRLT